MPDCYLRSVVVHSHRVLVSILVAALLAVTGLRGQTLSLGGSHVHENGHKHADHCHHHNHPQQPAPPAESHSHDEKSDHLHLTLNDLVRSASRTTVDLPKIAVFAIVPVPALSEICEPLHSPSRFLRLCEPWPPPSAGELTALRSIRLLV